MALIACAECGTEISDKAAACVKCGAPLAAMSINAVPVVVRKEPSTKWWIWIPLGLIAAFLLFGAMIPENTAKANRFARMCREMAAGNPTAQAECDREESSIRNAGQGVVSAPVNTSFVAQPATPPSSASNEEITRCVMYPQLCQQTLARQHKKP